MNISSIVFFDMVAAILVLAVALITVVLYLAKNLKILHSTLEEKDKAMQQNITSIDEARIKAIKIIDDANNHALDIVNKVTLSADIASKNYKDHLSRVSSVQIGEFGRITSAFTQVYSQILQDLKTKNVEIFQKVSKDIETSTLDEINNFKDSIQKLTILSQKEVKKKIDAAYEASTAEIEEYKKQQLQKIDSEIYGLIEKVSKLVIGKALDLETHEGLVEKSLEEAKKEGVFKP